VFGDVDFVVTPTAPSVAFRLGEKTADPLSMYLNDYCTVPMSLAGIPAISIPCGHSDGLPVGLQIAGPAFSENRLLDAAGRARAQHRLRREPCACLSDPQPTTGAPAPRTRSRRSSASRSTCSSRPGRRCSAVASCHSRAPNTRTCPVCLGLPGSLPVANERAVHFGLMIGLALGSELAPRSVFHRKNYFYPDLPKGYQITQYDEPLCRGGSLGDVRIHRVHLEEDAAKLVHLGASGRIHGSDTSIVDFNRGGTPLAEIVTEPDVRSPEQRASGSSCCARPCASSA